MAASKLIQLKQNDFLWALPLQLVEFSQRFIFGFDRPVENFIYNTKNCTKIKLDQQSHWFEILKTAKYLIG